MLICPAGANQCTDWGHTWQGVADLGGLCLAKFDSDRPIFGDRPENPQNANFCDFLPRTGDSPSNDIPEIHMIYVQLSSLYSFKVW